MTKYKHYNDISMDLVGNNWVMLSAKLKADRNKVCRRVNTVYRLGRPLIELQ